MDSVISFDPDTQTASIQPAVKLGSTAYPILTDVPVFMPVSFEIHPGDACLVIFSDVDIDNWFETGEASAPNSHGDIHCQTGLRLWGSGLSEIRKAGGSLIYLLIPLTKPVTMEMSITVGFDLLSFSFPTCVMIMASPILDRLSIRSPPFTVAISFIFSSIVLVFICVISFIVAFFRLTGKISCQSKSPVTQL